jgi:hypothetical protein
LPSLGARAQAELPTPKRRAICGESSPLVPAWQASRRSSGGKVRPAAPNCPAQRTAPRSHSDWRRETVSPQQSGLERFGPPSKPWSAMYLDASAGGLRTGTSVARPPGETRSRRVRRDVSRVAPSSDNLDQLPAGEQAVGREGVFEHPNGEGLPNWGRCRSPSLLHRSGTLAAQPRKAPSGLRYAPAGLCGRRGAWGEGMAPLRGVEVPRTPRSLFIRLHKPTASGDSSERVNAGLARHPSRLAVEASGPIDSRIVRPCSDGGHPGGRRSRERRE